MDAILTHARTRLARHLRSPALLWLALATPVLAPFLIPDPGAAYALIGVNGKSLALDPGSVGLQLGVLVAVLATPLAYIYLRAGPAGREPREVQLPTPGSRVALQLGAWVGDVLALWLWVGALAVAGVILSGFRTGEIAPLDTVLTTVLVGAPALAVVAGVRTLWESRPWLRGAAGDVAFFFVWTALVTASAALFGGAESVFADPLGFAAPLLQASPEAVEALYIGGSPKGQGVLEIDALRGVLDGGYLASRAVWLAAAAGLAALGGVVFKASAPKSAMGSAKTPAPAGPAVFESGAVEPAPLRGGVLDAFVTHVREVLHARWMVVLFVLAVLACALLPFRGLGGAVALFAAVALWSEPPARWRRTVLLGILPMGTARRAALSLGALLALAGVLLLVVFARGAVAEDGTSLRDAVLALPLAAVGLWSLGWVTRSAFAGRVLGFLTWYGYLNFALG